MAFGDWSTTASANTSVGSVNIAEGCPPGNMNNMGREIMAQLRAAISPALDDALADGTIGDVTGTLAALQALTLAADKLIYATSPTALATATLSAFGRSLIDDPDAATARATISAVGVVGMVLANPGYIKLSLPGTASTFMVQWGSGNASANANASIAYPTPFASFSIPVLAGAQGITSAQNNYPGPYAASTTGLSYSNSANSPVPFWWIAIGV